MILIQNWLSGTRNYTVGAILYKKLGTDEKLKKLFEGPHTAYLQGRLESELAALLQKPKVVLQDTPKKVEAQEMPESKDAVLEALRQEWLPLYQQMNYLRHELDKYEENTKEQIAIRKDLAFQILDIEQQCMQIWHRRNYYVKEGKLPEVKESTKPLPEDPVDLVKAEDAAKRNIRRNKQLAAQHPGNAVYPMKVVQYEKLLQEIQNKMKPNEGAKG